MFTKHVLAVLLCTGGPAMAQTEGERVVVAQSSGQAAVAPDETQGLTPESVTGAPKIYTAEPEVDLGTIREGESHTAKFRVENRGDQDLKIGDVRSSCGCTTVKLTEEQKTVPPGGSVEIEAKFNARGKSGNQRYSVTITSNDPARKTLRLTLRAFVETLVNVKPGPVLNAQNVRPGDAIPQPIDLIPGAGETTLQVESILISTGGLSYTQEPITEGDRTGVRLRFAVEDTAPTGALNGIVTLDVKVGGQVSKQTIRVTGRVQGDVDFAPAVIQAIQPAPRGTRLRAVTVRSTTDKPLRILSADAGSHIDVELTRPPGPSDVYQIVPVVSQSAPDGPLGALLRIFTDKTTQPVIDIPIFVNVSPRVQVSPPCVVLRTGDDAEAGSRRIHLSTDRGSSLTVTTATSDQAFVTAEIVQDPAAPAGRKAVEIRLNGEVPVGTHEAVVTVGTDVKEAESIRVPVTIVKGEATESAASAAPQPRPGA